MSTFALIHGAWHGAWCWERLIPELEQRGHRAVAMDLPCDDPGVTTMDNAKLVVDSLATAGVADDDDVVVVGHSLGGITAAVIPLLRPVRRVVFLAGLVPRPGRSLNAATSWGSARSNSPAATSRCSRSPPDSPTP